MRPVHRNLALLACLTTILLFAQAFAAPITVTPTGDAQGSLAAASGTGDADAAADCSYVPVPVALPGCVAGVAASGVGNASACASSYYGTVPCAGVAGALTGDASGCGSSYASTGLAPNCMATAASALGDSETCASTPEAYTDMPGCVGIAASGAGDAEACADAEDSYWSFLWTSCVGVAASATGEADACGNEQMVTLEDSRCIGVAVSGCDLSPTTCTDLGSFVVLAPANATVGEDADDDGFPSSVTIAFFRTTVDTDGNVTTEPDPSQDVTLVIDPDDADANDPVAQRLEASAPTGVAFGPDADNDGFPSRATVQFSRVTVTRSPPDVTIERTPAADRSVTLDGNDNNENVPAPMRAGATFPSNVVAGPDADNDSVPSYVRVEFSRLTVDRRNLTTSIERAPASDVTVRPDPNDNDPNSPVASTVSATAPSNVVIGADNDRDGVPGTVTIEFSRVTVDRRNASTAVAPSPASNVVLRPDANDNDPNTPVASVVRVPFASNVVVGADNDNDGFPSRVTVEMSELTVDRRNASHTTTRTPGADRVVTLDANDNDPNNPVASVLTVSVPTNATLGPDNDGDGVPAYVRLEFTRVSVDRRNATATAVRDPAGDRTIALDPNDNAPLQTLVVATVEGNATCSGVVCVAASVFGDAHACQRSLTCVAASGAGDANGYVAASALGDANSCDLDFLCTAASVAGDARGHDAAVSVLGNAQSSYLAASGTGDADGLVPLSGTGTCNGSACFGVEGDGHWLGTSTSGDAAGIVAIAPSGAAEGGLVAVSAFGPASGGLVAVSATGDAEGGLVAVSATGDASAPLSPP